MQVQFLKSAALRLLGIIMLTTGIFSFTIPSGSDRFVIYLNKKLVFEQFVSQASSAVKSFPLDRNNYTGTIDIVYSHCGAAGKDRSIKITDEKNHLLKEWKFGDGKDDKAFMTLLVKDVLLTQKENPVNKLNIYYASEQVPNGRMLASVMLTDHNAIP